ncbi:putative Acid phosphatase [Rosa chinensis]|uniref:Putative Acid phosphatase n=2 Tax=Rosa chinensis TaxID=74649 RepID=A0A2P6RXI9_ROSCH|nr:putative Acid phosphatase [Rosa chinensis]
MIERQQPFVLTMKALPVLQLLFLATLVATTQGSFEHDIADQIIHLLRPKSGVGGSQVGNISCLSWRLGVETHNIIDWTTIPAACEGYVGHYMLGDQYRKDSEVVTHEAYVYAEGLNLTNDGNNLWVFDIDETTLSNLPYYAEHGFGVEVYNSTAFTAWVLEGIAPALPESLKLYKKLLALGIKVAFITGREESQRNVTETNLKNVGYDTWETLVLKDSSYSGSTAVVYKSAERKKLEESGYRIIGNIGDQWSDIMGTNIGNRTFKLPDPMYYIS